MVELSAVAAVLIILAGGVTLVIRQISKAHAGIYEEEVALNDIDASSHGETSAKGREAKAKSSTPTKKFVHADRMPLPVAVRVSMNAGRSPSVNGLSI